MKGLELSEKFYLEYGAKMIHEIFPEIEGVIAVGLAGSGSECFGYDDEISRDHDFEAGFCLFIPDESVIDRKTAFQLERAYSKLPSEFCGVPRSKINPVGGNRHGVIRIADFLTEKTGSADGSISLRDWFFIPEQSVAEAVNGKIFRDDLGYFTELRQRLSYMPEDVRLKKLAGNLLVMGQAGQYNYGRCIARGERAAAGLAAAEFVKAALNTVFLLNKKYIPYYKWSFRALSELPILSSLYEPLEWLISSANDEVGAVKKQEIIEYICRAIITELTEQGLTASKLCELEAHAYSVNSAITDSTIRNLHILYAV